MTKVYVEYSEHFRYVQMPDPDDSWDIGIQDAGGQYMGVSLSKPGLYFKEFDIDNIGPGDTVFVVWCKYTTGCTFGRTEGQFDAMVCTDYKDIASLTDLLYKKHADYFGGVEETFVEVVEMTDEAPEVEDD